ncbi:Glycosyl transferase, group 2 family protein [Sulfitobacter noctilucae]|uniref:glycosyltransferase family 2 protein n=1 Tax=Sulfitobacter noctilucae TaxID=1342302 RepID=UPI000469F1A8|nr:glycosyltransferase family 2 protein [Sulfitobacter noctilucae]KIN61602.1 Glycosyl transferase, group 2 family protein [Sulfitobacter noctilucae]
MSGTSNPSVLVIVLNYRTAKMTLRAVEAALVDMPSGAELVIVDNASADGSAEVLAQAVTERGWDAQGRVRLMLSPVNGGYGAGNNIGLRSTMSDGSAPDYFYLLNSDAFPDAGCLPALVAHLEATPSAGLVGSHVRGEDDVAHTTAFRFPTIAGEFEAAARTGPISRLLRGSIIAPDLPQATTRVDWVAGASVLIRAAMLDEVGLFDETFFLYFEETDLIRRGAAAGWECWYMPDAKVVHIGSVSTGMKGWARVPDYWFASRQHYFVKNHGRAYAAAALAAKLAGGAIHNLRSMLSGSERHDPPGFYRDLLRHGFSLSRPATPKAQPAVRISEEKP